MLDDRARLVRARRRRRPLVAGVNEVVPADQEDAVAKPPTPAPSRPSSSNDAAARRRSRNTEETRREHRRCRDRRRPQEEHLPLRPAHARSTASSSSRSPRRCSPSARWRGLTSTTGTGWPRTASTSSNWRAAPWCPTTTTSRRAETRYQGITIPTRAAGHRGARRHPRDGRARAQHLPRCAEPVPVPRRHQAVAALRRRDRARGARREDRVGPHRLRRRPGQHRARRAHAGDDGHRAEEMAGLQRARARLGVHARTLARCPARRRDEPPDGHRHDHHDDGDHARTRGRAWSTRCCSCASTASPPPTWRSWATSA